MNSGDLIRGWQAIAAATGRSRVQIWRDIAEGRFPAPIALGPNSVAWIKSEIDAWFASRPRKTYKLPAPSVRKPINRHNSALGLDIDEALEDLGSHH